MNNLTKFRSITELANPRVDQSNTTIDVTEMTPEQKASAIIESGQRRRGEIPDAEPEPGTHAAEVLKLLKASRRARGVKED
jgi:hypothetical protein